MIKAQEFAKENIVFTIGRVYGLDLENISAVKKENEVLVKPPLTMIVYYYLKKDRDETGIMVSILNNNGTSPYPEVYVEGWMKILQPSEAGTSHASKGSRKCGTYSLVLVNLLLPSLFSFFCQITKLV